MPNHNAVAINEWYLDSVIYYVFSTVLNGRMTGNYNLEMMLKWLWPVL